MASKAKTALVGYVVVSHFRDINDFSKSYEPGEELADLPEDRIQTLLDRGLIETVVDEKAAAEAAKAVAAAEKKAEAEKAAALKKQEEEEAKAAAEAAKKAEEEEKAKAAATQETGK